MSNESISKILIVTIVLCLVCSILVSVAAVGLRPLQEHNARIDMYKSILSVAGLYSSGETLEKAFEKVEARVIRLDTGLFEEIDPIQLTADKIKYTMLSKGDDIAKIKRVPELSVVYLTRKQGVLDKVILPVYGYGLWSTLYGFIAIENDGRTVYGLQFYDHAETPGLGGEVDNPKWRQLWYGKQLYDEQGAPALTVIKGKVAPNSAVASYRVDGLSGATLTSLGVSHLIRFWSGELGYQAFLERVTSKEIS